MRSAVLAACSTGVVIGALNLAHYLTTQQMPDVETPFGLFPGGFPVAMFLGMTRRHMSPELVAMIVLGLGIMGGSFFSARSAGDLTVAKFRARKVPFSKTMRGAIGGVLMGAGTWMAQGCLVKHALSGAPGLMLSSFVTLTGIAAGIWVSAKLAQRRA